MAAIAIFDRVSYFFLKFVVATGVLQVGGIEWSGKSM